MLSAYYNCFYSLFCSILNIANTGEHNYHPPLGWFLDEFSDAACIALLVPQ